jgi:hypothetical protein
LVGSDYFTRLTHHFTFCYTAAGPVHSWGPLVGETCACSKGTILRFKWAYS